MKDRVNIDVRKWLVFCAVWVYSLTMQQNALSFYDAFKARDRRFDGLFYVGVTTTGIYCRPICLAKTPQLQNCRFFDNRETAEKDGFRPCLRCRPELAPGHAPVDDAQRIAQAVAQRLEEGVIAGDAGIETIAAQFELSSRQIRRILHKELGVSPIQLMQTRRLLLAKQLLTETALPVTEIAFASGFSSVRRFNDAFQAGYRMPPSRLRRDAKGVRSLATHDTTTIRLYYRPPYDWDGMLQFLDDHRIKGVERIANNTYYRTVAIGSYTGWIAVRHDAATQALQVEFTRSLIAVLPVLLNRVRILFDLDARPDIINAHLATDPVLHDDIQACPGLRVPGCFDRFELAVRAIMGQQITVKAATTLSGRFAQAFGRNIKTPFPDLDRLTPTSARIAKSSVDAIASLGIISNRTKSIIALAKAFQSGAVALDSGLHPNIIVLQLTALPGIGPWTADYIAMRALNWPDVFLKDDIAVRKNLGGISPRAAEALSHVWSPWRSYAVMHIWRKSNGIKA
jgi:AraC family transcriptional regulator of adaptative response / DNA-3-methyladenine glycosylase II